MGVSAGCVCGRAWKDTAMFRTPQACLEAGTEYPRYKLFVGFDVGKRFHAAHARTGSGRRVLALRIDNGEAAGCDVAYIMGKREKKARELFPGVAKNDAKDAEVIAAAAAGMPQSLLPVPREDDGLEGARRLRSQLAFSVKQSTQVKNRIRATLVESNAAFERLVDFSRPGSSTCWRGWAAPGRCSTRARAGSQGSRGTPARRSSPGSGRACRGRRGPPRSRCAARRAPYRCWPGGSARSRPTSTSEVYRFFGHPMER